MSCCREYAQTISEYLDGALDKKEQRLLLEHIEGCEACRTYLGELAAMHDALAQLPEAELPTGFHEGVMEKVRAKKRAKKTSFWKRYTAAACAAIVLVGAVRLAPFFGAGSSAVNETADGMMVAGGAEQRTAQYAEPEDAPEASGYMLDVQTVQSAESKEMAVEDAEAVKMSLPVVRGENVRETLRALGAEESGELLLVPVEVLENLPEGLTLEGEFDASGELILVLVEEVAA